MSAFLIIAGSTTLAFALYYGYMISTEVIRLSKRGEERQTETITVQGAEDERPHESGTIVTRTVTATDDGSYSIGVPEPSSPEVPKEDTPEEPPVDPFADALASTMNMDDEEELQNASDSPAVPETAMSSEATEEQPEDIAEESFPEDDFPRDDEDNEYYVYDGETKEASNASLERIRVVFETAEGLDTAYQGELSAEEALATLLSGDEESNIEKRANYEHL